MKCKKCGLEMFEATQPTVTTLANEYSKYVVPSMKVWACTCGNSEPISKNASYST